MNSLPGNPFVGEPDGDGVIDAVVFSADDSPMQTTELLLDQLKAASLALAHEQRTATLVNVVRMYADLGMGDQAAGIIDAITNRLGGHDHE